MMRVGAMIVTPLPRRRAAARHHSPLPRSAAATMCHAERPAAVSPPLKMSIFFSSGEPVKIVVCFSMSIDILRASTTNVSFY